MLSNDVLKRVEELISLYSLLGEPINDYAIIKKLVLEGLVQEDCETVWSLFNYLEKKCA